MSDARVKRIEIGVFDVDTTISTPSLSSKFSRGHNNHIFDETNTPINTSKTGSLNTLEIDRFRQGVEITQDKYGVRNGVYKISSGEPFNRLLIANYGQGKNYEDTTSFTEISLSSLDVVNGFNGIVASSDQNDLFTLNGIIEPLSVRSESSLSLIEGRRSIHSIKADIMDGNTSLIGSDAVSIFYTDSDTSALPFLDRFIDELPQRFPLNYSGTNLPQLMPYNDRHSSADIENYLSGSDIISAVNNLMPTQLNSHSVKDRSSSTGYTYEGNNGIKIDSIAFGGLVH